MHGRILQAVTVVITFALLITGCTSEAFNIGMAKDKENNVVDTGFSVSTVGSYDSADTAVVMSVDQENSCVVFMNMDAGRQYTLYYDGTTYVTDKYDGPMTISQLRAGDVVDVNFLKGKRQLASIKQSPSAWVYENIDNYDLGGINKTANIGSSTYYLPDEAVILSEGKRVEVMDVVAQDRVTIRGVDREIYSVNVEQGHGYLRLRNEQALIGGWIEVGNTVIREITEDMLLVVPEGSYQVALSNEGASSVKDVVIERDRETVLDVGDIEIIKDKTGKILFSVSPAGTEVTIDGNVTDISSAVELPYGIHQVHMEAEGYDSLTKYIQVGSEYAKISFELEKKKEEETPSVSENTLEQETEKSEIPELEYAPVKDPEPSVSENSISENTLNASKNNKVYIDAPKDVEVYVDSNYVGIAPISFKKSTGSHTVTLRKAGYKTRSYTIYLYNDGEDVTYSFTELEKEQSDTISGNDITSSKSTENDDKKTDHTHSYVPKITKDPTCIEKGVRTYTCNCGEKYTVEIPATGHDDKEEITKEPSCTEEGEKILICEKCGDTRTEAIPATGHNYKEEIIKEPTCTEEGEKILICEKCGDKRTEAISATGQHDFENGKCKVCNELDPAHTHDYKEEVIKEPTCAEEGEKILTCGCGDTRTEKIPATGQHDFKDGKCKNCGAADPGYQKPTENETEKGNTDTNTNADASTNTNNP